MGYYKGQGVVSSGSTDCSPGGSFTTRSGPIFITSRIKTTYTKFPGVSLETAQSRESSYNIVGGWWEDYTISSTQGYTYYNSGVVPEYSGDVTSCSYSQIGDSNLYELVEARSTKMSWRNTSQPVRIL